MLLDFFVAGGIAAAAATKGQWKQTKSAVALWKPSRQNSLTVSPS